MLILCWNLLPSNFDLVDYSYYFSSHWALNSNLIVFVSFVFFMMQCLMYLYHYPDIWYDYATWHAKNVSLDSAAKLYQRALKALPGNWLILHSSHLNILKFMWNSVGLFLIRANQSVSDIMPRQTT